MSATPIQLTPDPLAPFRISPGFNVNGVLFLSGHAAISETGELVGIGDFDAQAEATFQSLQRTLQAGGSNLSKVVKVTIYLTDMSYFERIVSLTAMVLCPISRGYHCRGKSTSLAGAHDRNRSYCDHRLGCAVQTADG